MCQESKPCQHVVTTKNNLLCHCHVKSRSPARARPVAQYEAAENVETKRTLAEHVFVELETHAQLEENIFYPAVNEGTDEGPDLVKDSVQEHQTMKH